MYTGHPTVFTKKSVFFTVSKYQEMVCAELADINQASAESCCQLNLTKRKQKIFFRKI